MRLGPLVRIQAVQPLNGFLVELTDGTRKQVDLAPFLHGPVFEPIRQEPAVFRSVQVIGSTIGWPNSADIDPDALYYNLTPAGTGVGETAR